MSLTPKARNTDPSTSHDAAKSLSNVELLRIAIYNILEANPQGLTDGQIQTIYDKARAQYRWPIASDSGMRSRRSELVEQGRVIHSGRYGTTESGRKTIIWEVSK